MKYKNILNIALTFVVGLLFVACSQSDDEPTSPSAVKMQNGLYVYDIDFNCPAPTYDAGTTRAVTYNWQLGQTMFVRFNSGSSHLLGFIARTAEGWLLISTGDLLDTSSSGTCELYYFQEANGDYYFLNADTGYFEVYNNGSFVKTTDIKWNTASFSLSEGTAVYSTTTGTYSHKPSSWTAEATLTPMMWRMRFSGSNGTSITLPGSDNDIQYCSAFNWSWSSTSSAPSFTKAAKDVSLSVSGGYTPYIYGEFASSGANKITVKNGNDAYTRNLNASSLPAGTSGYFDIPTASNYSSKGWTKTSSSSNIDASATIEPSLLVPFTDGMVTDWTIGSTVYTFDYSVFTKAGAEALTDDELAEKIYSTDPYYKEDAAYIFRNNNSESNQFYSPNTQYYLCAVAKNISGKRGPVCRYLFRTRTDGLPTALISNITPETTRWTFDITLRNGATSYYLGTSTDESRYKSDWHFWAYLVYQWGVTGQIESHDWASVQTTLQSGTCKVITIGTWGIDSNGSIGNPEVSYGSTSSSAPVWTQKAPKSTVREETIPKADLEEMMKNTRLYRVNR